MVGNTCHKCIQWHCASDFCDELGKYTDSDFFCGHFKDKARFKLIKHISQSGHTLDWYIEFHNCDMTERFSVGVKPKAQISLIVDWLNNDVLPKITKAQPLD